MDVSGGAVAVLFSPHAQESRNASTLQKFYIRFRLKTGSQCQCGLIARKNPLEVTLQLLMFRCYVSTGTIGVLLLRFRFQQVDHFVGALWICSKFSAMGTSANIR